MPYKYVEKMYNTYLGKTATIRADSKKSLKAQKEQQRLIWAQELAVKYAAEKKKQEKQEQKLRSLKTKEEAVYNTFDVEQRRRAFTDFLRNTVLVDFAPNWEEMLAVKPFPDFTYVKPAPSLHLIKHKRNVPSPSFFEKILPFLKSKRERKEEEANNEYAAALAIYENEKAIAYAQYLENKNQREAQTALNTENVLNIKKRLEERDPEIIEMYMVDLLEKLPVPPSYKEFDLEAEIDEMGISIDIQLHDIGEIPTVKEYRYVAARDEVDIIHLKDAEIEKIYVDYLHQLILGLAYAIFSALRDVPAMSIVSITGYFFDMDEVTGKPYKKDYISATLEKEALSSVDLSHVKAQPCVAGIASEYKFN